jgi:hypothetical protein
VRHLVAATLCAAAALAASAAPALAQQHARDCPPARAGAAAPVELRIAGIVLRMELQAEGTAAAGDSARLDARLVGCEDASRRHADADAGAAAPGGGLLRLLHDVRFGLQFAPSADGRCIRARVDVRDEGPDAGRDTGEPVAFELCGLPFGRVIADPDRRL